MLNVDSCVSGGYRGRAPFRSLSAPAPPLRPEFDRLLLFRAVRPDRLTSAMSRFVTGLLGAKYVTSNAYDLERSYAVRGRGRGGEGGGRAK